MLTGWSPWGDVWSSWAPVLSSWWWWRWGRGGKFWGERWRWPGWGHCCHWQGAPPASYWCQHRAAGNRDVIQEHADLVLHHRYGGAAKACCQLWALQEYDWLYHAAGPRQRGGLQSVQWSDAGGVPRGAGSLLLLHIWLPGPRRLHGLRRCPPGLPPLRGLHHVLQGHPRQGTHIVHHVASYMSAASCCQNI